MEDEQILQLYWSREEEAIRQTRQKYGAFCYGIAYQLLQSREDAQECENDTYLAAWNRIPPQRPLYLQAFLGKITRNHAMNRLRARMTKKRGAGEAALSLDELKACIPTGRGFEETIQARELAGSLSTFLRSLPAAERRVFICRYWYCDAISQISRDFGFGESKVKMMLLRTRKKLARYLEKEGYFL